MTASTFPPFQGRPPEAPSSQAQPTAAQPQLRDPQQCVDGSYRPRPTPLYPPPDPRPARPPELYPDAASAHLSRWHLPAAVAGPVSSCGSSPPVAASQCSARPVARRVTLAPTTWDGGGPVYLVSVDGIQIARREDTRMINGTKLINVSCTSRGRRDGLLKIERHRHVIKIGPVHMKGVWIPFERAYALAEIEGSLDRVFPLFAPNIHEFLPRADEPLSFDNMTPADFSRQFSPSQIWYERLATKRDTPRECVTMSGSALPAATRDDITCSTEMSHILPTPPTSASSSIVWLPPAYSHVDAATEMPAARTTTVNAGGLHPLSGPRDQECRNQPNDADTLRRSPSIMELDGSSAHLPSRTPPSSVSQADKPPLPRSPSVTQMNGPPEPPSHAYISTPSSHGYEVKGPAEKRFSHLYESGPSRDSSILIPASPQSDVSNFAERRDKDPPIVIPATPESNISNLVVEDIALFKIEDNVPDLSSTKLKGSQRSRKHSVYEPKLMQRVGGKERTLERLMKSFDLTFSILPVRSLHYFDSSPGLSTSSSVSSSIVISDTTESTPKNFACPYFKRDPSRYRRCRPCGGPGWESIPRVKEHLYRVHALVHYCVRCQQKFESGGSLQNHVRAEPACHVAIRVPLEGFDYAQEKILRSKKVSARYMADDDKWRDIYLILFPDDVNTYLPNPYIEDDAISFARAEMACYERYLRRELATRVREELATMIDQFTELNECVWKKKIAAVARDVQCRLFQQYKISRIAELQGSHCGRSGRIDTTSQGQEDCSEPCGEPDDAESYLNRMLHGFNGLLFDFSEPSDVNGMEFLGGACEHNS